jgi:hypothetical protein
MIKKNDSFGIPQGFNAKQTAKMIASKFGVNASDFIQFGNKIIFQPKKKVVFSKPANMTVKDYFEKIVLPNNDEIAAMVAMYDDEVWLPIQNIGRYFEGEVDYSQFYEVSNKGRIKMIDCSNAMKSNISVGYDTPTRNAMQFTLNDRNGKRTTSDVKYMVADAFLGDHDIKLNEVIHIDGDYHNNKSENLMWVTR